ncbi:hypothetical protein WN55_01379 [Dufourea novaeangliae]|uniref:Uncharacterized protein n=1 Tax=Dufourea novaeangliae TaxID=178035 RepID=A0A154PEJ1_DUFNO|nr:hypothetical protein WN55_01379 [Dufourea novaeangliae]
MGGKENNDESSNLFARGLEEDEKNRRGGVSDENEQKRRMIKSFVEEALSVCMDQSICGQKSAESSISVENFEQPCPRNEASRHSTCGNYSVCYNITEEQDLLAEELLKRLSSKQNSLESICLEGLSLIPDEGIRLLTALYNSRETMKYVYCWRAFEKMVGISTDDDCRAGSRFRPMKKINKRDWFCAIGCLECLTTLSINYEYIATPTGDLLVNLARKLQRNWQWLQLLCLEEEVQNRVSVKNNGLVLIPDKAWRKAHSLAPALKIQYAIIGIPEYDIHKQFLTKSTRIHTFALSTGIDLRFRQPWCLDCTIKTLCSWYSNSLVYLCLQLWHSRENLDIQLRKLFLNLPSLRVFEYVGEIRTLKTLCIMCCQIRSGSCSVCHVNMQLQDIIHENIDEEKWVKSIKCLMVCFKHDFEKLGITFNINFYKS